MRFTFKQPDRELPLILALMPILPKHAIDAETFDKSTLKPVIGSGPYTAGEGKRRRAHHLQAQSRLLGARTSLPSAASTITTRSRSTISSTRTPCSRRSRKVSSTSSSRKTAAAGRAQYDFPAVAQRRRGQGDVRDRLPSGMPGFVMNTRRPMFQDPTLARRAGQPVRLRMGQQQPVFRRLHAHQELLRQFRPFLVRPSGKRRGKRRCLRPSPTP